MAKTGMNLASLDMCSACGNPDSSHFSCPILSFCCLCVFASTVVMVMMQISLRTRTGNTFLLQVDLDQDTVGAVKTRLEDQVGIPANQQSIVHAGKQLKNSQRLSECNITASSAQLQLSIDPEAGLCSFVLFVFVCLCVCACVYAL